MLDLPFKVRSSGEVLGDPMHSSAVSKQGDVMMCFFYKGSCHYMEKGQDLLIESPKVVFFKTSNEGVLVNSKENPGFHFYCRFQGNYALQMVEEIKKKEGGYLFEPSDISPLMILFKQLKKVIKRDLPNEMGDRESSLMQILVLLKKGDVGKTHRKIEMDDLQMYLLDRIAQKINLEEMASFFHVSVRHLCRVAKSLLNKPIAKYHNGIKMDLAMQLLEGGHLKINEVAKHVGYEDPLYFSKVFKKHYGKAPTLILNTMN